MEIRNYRIEDYDEVNQLWRKCGLNAGRSDKRDEVEKVLKYNPDTCFIALEDGIVVGSVIGGYDGRRGIVHHLAVNPSLQGKGYGGELMSALEKRFTEKGVVKMSFWVHKRNIRAIDYYETIGYHLRDDIVTMSKVLRD